MCQHEHNHRMSEILVVGGMEIKIYVSFYKITNFFIGALAKWSKNMHLWITAPLTAQVGIPLEVNPSVRKFITSLAKVQWFSPGTLQLLSPSQD